ncbi:MAG: C25 family cysteine peptidase [Bacteroidetes bacterium]|nr:C25 family cysteine peptidase [Bacteroidota bacterium]
MKKVTIPFIIIFVSLTQLLFAQTYTFHFEKPVLKQTADGYTVVNYTDCINFGKEGTPELPYRGIDLLLPQNQEVVQVKVVSLTMYSKETGIRIKPAVKPVPVSKFNGEMVTPIEDEAIYSSSSPYPATNVSTAITNYLCGHGIASFTICPVIYIPAQEEVQFIQDIVIEIQTASTSRANAVSKFLKTSALIENRINYIVENPEMLNNYSYSSVRDNDEYDLLLITKNSLLPAFEEYIAFKIATGFFVKAITTEEIYAQYTGQDDQEKIRNCIIDYYSNYGIQYVILGGDADPMNPADRTIPHRGFIAVDDNDIPCDMYYSNLDGNWNTNGNNSWGEPGEWDLYSEVSIGRICVDDEIDIANFTNKLFLYQDAPVVADIEKGVMVGEQLDSGTWGDTYKDEIANGSSNNGYTTTGFPLNFTLTKLYESVQMWDKTNIFDQFNFAGVNLMNHLGHSNVDYNMKMYNSDLTTTNFTNDGITRGFVIGYSQGCYNGAFDNRNDAGSYGGDCFAETFTSLETGEVASIANSRYGWYNPGGTNSSSQYYDRQFFDALFGEDIFAIGDVNAESKEDDVSYISTDEYCRWVAYETNLFGDPSMNIWTATPTDISADYPVSISIGNSEISFVTDAPFARIAIAQNGELIGRGIADANGNATVTFPTILDPAPLDISITAHNKNRHTGSVLVISNQPYIIYQYNQVNDVLGDNDGLLDYGESVYLSVAVTNVGDQPAANATVTISTSDPFVTITENSYFYGTIQPGQTKMIDDAFAADISAGIPDQHNITFDLEISAQDTWYADFALKANAPVLSIGNFIVDDSESGNNNGNIDPGETVDITIQSSNFGHCDAFNAIATLVSTSEWINIIESTYTIGDMPADMTTDVIFTVEVDDYAPIGAYVDFTYTLTSGDYSLSSAYSRTIGLVYENWETGDFSKFTWSSSSTWPWFITANSPYEGEFCIRSGAISNDETSNIKTTYNCVSNDSISFYRRISTQPDYDYLSFFIDNVLIDQWSGFYDWARFSYPVTPGVHTFKWEYDKDNEEYAGLDCAWVDYIVFPPTLVTGCFPGPDTTICIGNSYQCQATVTNYTTLLWTTSGTGTYNNDKLINPVYYPSQQDFNNGSVILSLTAYSNLPCGDITRDFTLAFNPLPSTPVTPLGPDYVDLYYTTVSEYTIEASPFASTYAWQLMPVNAGSVSGSGTTGTVDWNPDYLGMATVSVKSINYCGESPYSEEFNVEVDNTVGLAEKDGRSTITIVPNPNNGKFMLNVDSKRKGTATLTIVNSYGSVIYSTKSLELRPNAALEIDLKEAINGVYYLEMSTGEYKAVRKFVILK